MRVARDQERLAVAGWREVMSTGSGQCESRLDAEPIPAPQRVLDVETGKTLLRIPEAHSGIVVSARFSPDDRWIASGGTDNVVRLWDATTGERKETLIGHTSVVNDAVFSPDGKRLASTGWDQTVKVWALDLN